MKIIIKCNIFILFFLIPSFAYSFKVASTIMPLHLILSEITKGVNEPVLINNKSSPHDYQLTPRAAQVIENSDVIFYISHNLETFIKGSNKSIELLPLVPNIIMKPVNNQDIHIWLDPNNAKKIVEIMVNHLAALDETHAEIFHNNANSLIERINSATSEIFIMISNTKIKEYFVVHDAYRYFTNYFNLPDAISITHGDNHSLSISKMQKLLDSQENSCIILDPTHDVRLPKNIPYSVRVITINPLGNLGITTYTELLLDIARNLHECLS